MAFSTPAFLMSLFVAVAAAAMACLLLVRRPANSLHRTLAGLLGATALANIANGMALLDAAHTLLWREIALVGELIQPAALLYVGQAFLRPTELPANSSM